MEIKFTQVKIDNLDEHRWIQWLNAEIFPNDVPVSIPFANWWLAWDDKKAIAFCGWRPYKFGKPYDSYLVGFQYRAGVLSSHRGNGLQKQMIEIRETDMIKNHIKVAGTYTEVYSAASMRSFINAGYRPYEATDETALTSLDRYKRFVHWRKNL